MSVIIIDFGSGETCQNNKDIVKRMIDGFIEVDSHKHEIYFKWQLFSQVPAPVPPLEHDVYSYAVQYALKHDYLTGASVFDEIQLEYLLRFRGYCLPFIKIACRPDKYRLLDKMPHEVPLYVSVENGLWVEFLRRMWPERFDWIRPMYCVPEYPANQDTYERIFGGCLHYGISDHSPNLRLFEDWTPLYYERHFKLPDSTGLDAGVHASTPEQLKAIL
jgi:hypothetical protein